MAHQGGAATMDVQRFVQELFRLAEILRFRVYHAHAVPSVLLHIIHFIYCNYLSVQSKDE